jgi:hypothetical protein
MTQDKIEQEIFDDKDTAIAQPLIKKFELAGEYRRADGVRLLLVHLSPNPYGFTGGWNQERHRITAKLEGINALAEALIEKWQVENAGLRGLLEVEDVAKGIHFVLVDILVNYRKGRGLDVDAPSLTEELNNILAKLATLERENAELKAGEDVLFAEVKGLKAELETARLQLAGCGVAAMQNTEKTIADRITKDNPNWSASYGDVCNAVDREMKLRSELETMKVQRDLYKRCLDELRIAVDIQADAIANKGEDHA